MIPKFARVKNHLVFVLKMIGSWAPSKLESPAKGLRTYTYFLNECPEVSCDHTDFEITGLEHHCFPYRGPCKVSGLGQVNFFSEPPSPGLYSGDEIPASRGDTVFEEEIR